MPASACPPARPADVTIVIVTYNSAQVLPACLASIPKEARVVVVDNASTDGSATLAARLRPDGRVIRTPENLGFGRAANLGFADASTRFGLLLNADARCAPGMLDALLAAAERYPRAGLLAPAVHTPDGRLEFGRLTLFDRRGRRTVAAEPQGDCSCLSYVGGSAMFFPLEVFRAVGGFDPDIFLYYEDDDLCLRMRRAGWSLVHVHAARLEHIGGRSSAPSARLDWGKEWHMGWSRQHIVRKHRGPARAAMHAILQLAGLGARLAFRWSDPRRRRWAARAAGIAGCMLGKRATAIGMP